MPGQKRLSLAGIGCGSRTRTYMELAMERKDRYRIAAAADPVKERAEAVRDFAPEEEAEQRRQQRRQCTHNAHQHCLLLHGRQRLFFRLCILSHSFHHSLYCALFQARCSSSWSARSAQLSASSTGWKGASSSRLP